MDATFYRLSRLPVLGCALFLSGCQAVAPGSDASAKPDNAPGVRVFNALLNEQPLPASIVRDDKRITYIVMTPEGQALRYMARFDINCSGPFVKMAYRGEKGMVEFADHDLTDLDTYLQIPEPQRQQFLDSARFKQMCTPTAAADWRVISAPDRQDWHLIDLSGLTRTASTVTFWTAQVFPVEQLQPGGVRPLSQVRRQVLADCAHQQLTALSSFNMSLQNRVVSGNVNTDPHPMAVKDLPMEDRKLFDAACSGPQALAGYAPYEGRKQAFFDLPTPEIAASVATAIDTLQLPAPRKSLTRLQLSAREFANGKWLEETGRGRLAISRSYVPFQPGKQLTEIVSTRQLQLRETTFRGLIELAQNLASGPGRGPVSVKERMITDLHFSGDWTSMPLGSQLRYTVQEPQSRYGKADERVDTSFTCDIDSRSPASAFYPTLSGNAKRINCSGNHDHWGKGVAVYAYLEDYGLFVPMQFFGTGSQVKWTIELAQ
ncbi:hypothetical protein SAMN03159444_03271 [Pseudomonas sp. NFACC02]|nr:hypothetical protein SAMN03159444_03271 [Pseudomonas sp. NFACC02]